MLMLCLLKVSRTICNYVLPAALNHKYRSSSMWSALLHVADSTIYKS